MSKTQEPVVVADVLKRYSEGEKITLRESLAVTSVAVALRNQFNDDMFKVMQNPSALDSDELHCIVSLAGLLFRYGLLSPKEMENFQKGIGMLG